MQQTPEIQAVLSAIDEEFSAGIRQGFDCHGAASMMAEEFKVLLTHGQISCETMLEILASMYQVRRRQGFRGQGSKPAMDDIQYQMWKDDQGGPT